MKNEEAKKLFCVTLTSDNLSEKTPRKYITGMDIVSDVCYCLGLSTWEGVQDGLLDCQDESARIIVRGFDWSRALREKLNADTEANKAPHVKASEYLAGDYLHFQDPKAFAEALEKFKEDATDYIEGNGFWEDEAKEHAPESLINELRSDSDWTERHTWNEWLHGDGRRYGVIGEISNIMTASHHCAEYLHEAGELVIEFTEEDAREFMGYELEDGEPVSAPELQKCVIEWLLKKEALATEKKEQRRAEFKERAEAKRAREMEKMEKEKAEARKRKQEAGQ